MKSRSRYYEVWLEPLSTPGSLKSSSRTLSDRFNLLHVDTGSFYRAITAELLRRGVHAGDLAAVKAATSVWQRDRSHAINAASSGVNEAGVVEGLSTSRASAC